MKAKNIIFDFGGVLVDWNPRYLYRQIFKEEKDMEYFLTHICNQTWNEHQDAGRPWSEAITERVALFPQYEAEIRAYHDRWPEMMRDCIPDTVAILRQLHSQGTPLYGLTNWSQETFPIALARFDFFKCFTGIVVSGEVKLKKPDPRIFKHLLSRFCLRAEECLFIDDVLTNIESADRLGFQTVHFHSPEQLQIKLNMFYQ